MSNTNIAVSEAKTMCDALVDALDSGASAGYLRIYDDGASQPADPDSSVPAGSTKLVEFTLSDPAFGDAVDDSPGAKATANSIADATAVASGTALWFRAFASDGTAVIDGDVSATGNGGDLQLGTTSISNGVTVSISSWTVTMPQQ